ncbi:MAG: VOC family protein [Microlunatus sp.]|nr:VOC family protein [Microlunatus sp.]
MDSGLTVFQKSFKLLDMPGDPFDRLAHALVDVLRELSGQPKGQSPSPDTATGPEPAPRPADEHSLGKRQRQIVDLVGLTTEDGLRTAEIADAIDYDTPNTYTALQALARSQVVEQVPGGTTQRWRLVQRYRKANSEFEQAIDRLAPDEWTTAADLSIAIRGDLAAAEAIITACLSDQVRRGADGDPAKRVTWDELRRRHNNTRERKRIMSRGTLNYLQIPAVDLEQSIRFYEQVFGWTVRRHGNLSDLEQTSYPEFADATGNNGGGFVLGRPPSREPGLLPCIAVDSIDETLQAAIEHGGEVVKPKTAIVEGVDWEAELRDPAGNVFGLFESTDS